MFCFCLCLHTDFSQIQSLLEAGIFQFSNKRKWSAFTEMMAQFIGLDGFGTSSLFIFEQHYKPQQKPELILDSDDEEKDDCMEIDSRDSRFAFNSINLREGFFKRMSISQTIFFFF